MKRNGFETKTVVKRFLLRLGVVTGSIKVLGSHCIILRSVLYDGIAVSYNKTKLLWRPSGLVYCQI